MSIKFRVIEKSQPGVSGGGEKKYYASAKATGELTLNTLSRYISANNSISGADVRAVLFGMVEVISQQLAEGKIIRMGDLGSLRIGLSSNGESDPNQVNFNSIRKTKMIFNPGKVLKEMQKELKFEKV